MYSRIIEGLDILSDTKDELNDNTLNFISNVGIFDREVGDDAEESTVENCNYDYREMSEDSDIINDTYSLAQNLDLNYPVSANDFRSKKATEYSNLNSNFSSVSPVITMNFGKDVNFGSTGKNQFGDSHVNQEFGFNFGFGLVDNDTIGIKDKHNEINRDPLMSSVAGSISSSSFSLNLSNDQLSPSSILSSNDIKSFNQSQSDLDKDITVDHDCTPALQSMASSSSFLMVNMPTKVAARKSKESSPAGRSPTINYVKQPRQGRYTASRRTPVSCAGTDKNTLTSLNPADCMDPFTSNDSLSLSSRSAIPNTTMISGINSSNAAGPVENDFNKKVSDSRLSAQGLAQVLRLDSPVEALKRERYILDIFENELHYPLGYKTWVRDTKKEYRTKLIDELHDRVKEKYPEYDHHVLETIIRRATYYMMQSRLRRERRAKAKGIKVSRSTSVSSSLS